jgi:tRNA A-37 threonylcarbamoyl transferase component Bud32
MPIGPEEGLEWRPPHGYSQTVRWDGNAVIKQFSTDTLDRAAVEGALLARLAPEVPVPELLAGGPAGQVRMQFVPGILGQDWVAKGRPATDPERVRGHVAFMSQCGQLLRRIHQFSDTQELPLPGAGPVIVHGDFAPYNIIVDPDNGAIRAVIDWELAHRGTAVVDLAWMEWNMRSWYSPQPGVMEAFYARYGELPTWPDRHAAMLERCERHVARALRPSYPSPEARARWVEQLERTRTFTEIVTGG